MSERTVMLFAGQGAYLPGVLSELANTHRAVDHVVRVVDDIAARYGVSPVRRLLVGADAPAIDQLLREDPDVLQLCVYATTLAAFTAYADVYGVRSDVLLGHSVGELTALVAAGAFTVGDGARIVCERGRLLRELAPAGGLLALGLPTDRTEHLVAALAEPDLAVAAVNAPRQTVVSGTDAALRRLEEVANALDVRHIRLRSPHMFHNGLLGAVRRRLAEVIADIAVHPMSRRVYSAVHGRFYVDDDDVKALVLSGLTRRVDFLGAVRLLQAHGGDHFVDCGAGGALARLVTESTGSVRTVSSIERGLSLEEFERQCVLLPGYRSSEHTPTAVRGTAPAPDTVTPPVDQPAPPAAPAVRLPERTVLIREIRRMYADAIDVPDDLITDEIDLEADLGVDSLTQNRLLAQIAIRYGLVDALADVRTSQYTTLPEVADLVGRLAGER